MAGRGFAVVALDNPKFPENIGAALRACGCYSVDMFILGGKRPNSSSKLGRLKTDTQKAWRHIPCIITDDLFDVMPYDCVPIAVDMVDGAVELPGYVHPERACYIFGAEDATLGKRVLDRCRDIVVVPTVFCMNLAACVNVILYDRMAKRIK